MSLLVVGKARNCAPKLPGPVYSLDLAADGRHLASANADGTLYIFRLPQLTPKPKK